MASLFDPRGLTIDGTGSVYFSDYAENVVRKIQGTPTLSSDSFAIYSQNTCDGINFAVISNSYSVGQHLKTYFGDGSSLDSALTFAGITGVINFSKPYTSSGIYRIKHVLYDGTTAVDSISYYDTLKLCQNFSINFFNDVLGTCVYNDSADRLVSLPVLVEIDSNSIPIDTVSATSGLYYTAYGNPGDVYTFKLISSPEGMYATCPSTAVVYDTMYGGTNATKYFGFVCFGSSSFDLSVNSGAKTGRHMQTFCISASNSFCNAKNSTLNMTFSPKYEYGSAVPAPTSVSGNVASWDLRSLSFFNSNKNIHITLNVPGAWLLPGDTVMTQCAITPIVGDTDTLNNVVIVTDTVKTSYDPNEISVSPQGCIPPGVRTNLQYTVMFENTGNDTAHNIYILDTLSDNLDPRSLRIVSAPNATIVSKWYDTTWHNIYKFEFPGINLLDSSYHNQCDGMIIFNINTKVSSPAGASVFNHVGIFFDDNPVVLTNSVENFLNTVPHPNPISGNSSVCPGASISLSDSVAGGVWSSATGKSNVNSEGLVTGLTMGTDTILYTITNACGSGNVKKSIMVNSPTPHAGIITGLDSLCSGTIITLNDTALGGTWRCANVNAIISGIGQTGLYLKGANPGFDTVIYTITNSCGTAVALAPIHILPLPFAGMLTVADTVCNNNLVAISSTVAGGVWRSTNTNAVITGNTLKGIAYGMDTLYYICTNSCGSDTASKHTNVLVAPVVSSVTGPDSICANTKGTFTDTAAGGIWSSSNSNASITNGILTEINSGWVAVIYTLSNYCGVATASQNVKLLPMPVKAHIIGPDEVCLGTISTIGFTADVPGGTWSSTGGGIDLVDNGVIGLSAGSDTVFYTLTNSCGTAVSSRTISVIAPPDIGMISGETTLCVGSVTQFIESAPGGIWSSRQPDIAIVSPASGEVTAISAGTDIIQYTNTNNCGTASQSIHITVDTIIAPGIHGNNFINADMPTDTLYALPAGGSWTTSSSHCHLSEIPGSVIVSDDLEGVDTITYHIANVCGEFTASIAVTIFGKNKQFNIFPNPNQGLFTLLLPSTATTIVKITDLVGNEVYNNTYENNTYPTILLDLQALATGTYFVKVNCGGKLYREKIMILH